jgi:cupin superfamily acireductone dioxygenase involved in methionine salvage
MSTNNSKSPVFAEKEDNAFFKAMDENSLKMRQSAIEMVDTLKSMNIKCKEIESVIKSLIAINTVDIKMMDKAMNELTQTFGIFNAKIVKNSSLAEPIQEEQLKKFSDDYNHLTNEISLLVKKAFELRQ